MLHFVDAAREYNQANSPLEAITVTDVCWSIFDCIKAAGEGIFQDTIGTVINHPIETVLCVCAPEYLLAYHVGKIAYAYLDVKITSFMDQEAGEQKLVDYLKPLTDCIDIITNRDITLRGSIKMAATVTTQILIQGKLNTGLKTFYETTKKRAQNYLKTDPAATAKQYLATPDGMLLKASGGPGKNGPSLRDMGGSGQKDLTSIISTPNTQIIEEPFKFTLTTIKHMENPNRAIPVQILKMIIDKPMCVLKDPQGTNALMYYSQMIKNKQLYNVEILYNKEMNQILHFLYQRGQLGPLPKVKK